MNQSSSSVNLHKLYKSTGKPVAGTAVVPPTPPPTIGRRSRRHSTSSVDTNRADFLPYSNSAESSSCSQFDLYARHPSLSFCMALVRESRGSTDVARARALARVLLVTVTDVIHLMNVPEDTKDDQKYQENLHCVSFMIQQLNVQFEGMQDVEEPRKRFSVDRMVDMAELTLAALERLLQLTERMSKPLPCIPVDEDGRTVPTSSNASRSTARISFAQMTAEILENAPSEQSSSRAFTLDSASTNSVSSSRTTTILAILKKARQNGLGSLLRHKGQAPKKEAEVGKEAQTGYVSPQYAPRNSALYYPVDPLHPGVDIELPPLSGDTMNIELSHDNTHVIKSSPIAIIRLLTSKDAIQDPTLLHWFFTTFRYVLLSSEVLDLLLRRYNETMPQIPMTHEQARVWCNNQHGIVRPRVISVLIRWLTQYWEPPYDTYCVLNDMQDFVLKQVAASFLPEKLGIAFAQAIKGVRVDGMTRTKWLQKRVRNTSNSRLACSPFTLTLDHAVKFPIALFDCSAGHEAMANSLTILEVELYGRLPTQALMRAWLKSKTKGCEDRMKERLSEVKKRHKGAGKQLARLLQQADGSSSRVLVETLASQQTDLLRESGQLAMEIYAYQVTEREMKNSALAAEQAAFAVKSFDRSLSMFVLHTIILDSKSLDDIYRSISFWLAVGNACVELNNINSAWTIFWASTYSTVVGRLFDILPAWEGSKPQETYNKLNALFTNDLRKVDELPESVASVPRFQYLIRNVTHITESTSSLMADNSIHAQSLRIIGKTISAIEATRLYVLPEDSAVQPLLQNHIARFSVANEAAHMQWFTKRSEDFKPRKARRTTRTASMASVPRPSPQLSPPPSPKSEVAEILFA
ncbi:hypothetical protein D9757_005482 [Collybiopsis confluens]|uniref:N-terminal Ras-GEF domain-containing protein n=1 Tax=Collybiopsis confluens TaxID=2823264 RepID=A0A8H5HLT0_9AGAR|nr:hypothetical protein D9757_005482 [Collybiopsis confluens]